MRWELWGFVLYQEAASFKVRGDISPAPLRWWCRKIMAAIWDQFLWGWEQNRGKRTLLKTKQHIFTVSSTQRVKTFQPIIPAATAEVHHVWRIIQFGVLAPQLSWFWMPPLIVIINSSGKKNLPQMSCGHWALMRHCISDWADHHRHKWSHLN